MAKIPVENRHGLNMMVRYTPSLNLAGKLVFLQHGYSGSMDQPALKAWEQTYLNNGYGVCTIDTTHSLNDAEGALEHSTAQSHYDDFCDCIEWAKNQDWYREPFAMAGHSMGGMSVLRYAQDHPDKVTHLFPCAAATTGPLLEEAFAKNRAEAYLEMKKDGYNIVECWDGSGRTGKRPYSWLETMQDVDTIKNAHTITAPTLLVVGTEDEPTPPEHQQLLFDALTCQKEIHILDGIDHNFEIPGSVEKTCELLDAWLKKQG